MKIRTGFVSNSSSSSFIVVKNDPKESLNVTLDISSLAKNISTEEEFKELLIERFYLKYSMDRGSSFEEVLKEQNLFEMYQESLDILRSGKTLAYLDVASDGEMLEQAVYYGGLGNLKTIYSSEG